MHTAIESKPRASSQTRESKAGLSISSHRWAAVADVLLIAAIVIAPVAGGSSHPWMLLVLAPITALAYVSTLSIRGSRGPRLQLIGLPVALVGLALISLLQIVPLPEWLLGLLSPRALETRQFVGDGLAWRPISYEPAATAREAAKLLICAMIAFVAFERARSDRRLNTIVTAVVVAALASAVVALVHRIVGADRMLGLLPSHRAPDVLVTTFVNQNHAAGFMVLAALASLGLGLAAKTLGRKVGFVSASMLLVIVSVLSYSRGGLLALAFGTALLLALLAHREKLRAASGGFKAAGIIGAIAVMIISASVAIAWRFDSVAREFNQSQSEADPLGITAKLGAMKDAWPMVFDHPWLGIGRGSYISVYTSYKTYPHQFTFTHPENLVAQLASDWGPIIGSFALAGLILALFLRIVRSESPVALGALAGVVALVAQNLVDFSLEVLGAAIPVAAILGATAAEIVRSRRVSLSRPWAPALALGAPILVLALATAGAFSLGDLETDLATLKGEVQTRLAGKNSGETAKETIDRLHPIVSRHPANAVVTAQLAYIAEISRPPDLSQAIYWANRTLALAPTYADGHLSTGRILARAGHRKQGFMEMRLAWSAILQSPRIDAYVREVIRWAESPEEIAIAIPRVDPVQDRLDEREVARASRQLRAVDKMEWARTLMQRHADPETARLSSLVHLATESAHVKDDDLAARFLARRLRESPKDERAARLLIELNLRRGQLDVAQATLDEILAAPGIDRTPLAKLSIDLALKRGQIDLARTTLEQLRNGASPTHANQILFARLEASIEDKASHPGRAVEAINHAIRLAPSNATLRLERARLLLRLNRRREARSDLEVVIRAEPENKEARALLAQVAPPAVPDALAEGEND